MFVSILLIIIGFIGLIKGADFLVEGASNIAKKFNIPEIIIALTIVSIGTSMPELFVSLTSGIDGLSDISIGNVVGSNIANLLLILGITAIIRPIVVKKETKFVEIPVCFITTLIFWTFCNLGGNITRLDGIVFVALFLLFIVYTIIVAIKHNQVYSKEKREPIDKISLFKDIIDIGLGIIALKIGAELTVDNAINISRILNISEKVISVTVLAVGTSLPELFTSVSAAIKGKSDIAIGNIVGSNIFNILLILGVTAIINPLTYNMSFNKDLTLLIISTVLLMIFPFIPKKDEMTRGNGVIYLILYFVYIGTLIFI